MSYFWTFPRSAFRLWLSTVTSHGERGRGPAGLLCSGNRLPRALRLAAWSRLGGSGSSYSMFLFY